MTENSRETAITSRFWQSPKFWEITREVFSRCSLPVLALSASNGVYNFARFFVGHEFAIIEATAFELTYLGLAVVPNLGPEQRKRARKISYGAVAVSILYNFTSGFLHRNPTFITGLGPGWGLGAETTLAILHGLPLAWVAFLVADLLLHKEGNNLLQDAQALASSLRGELQKVETKLQEALGLQPALQSAQELANRQAAELQRLAEEKAKLAEAHAKAWQQSEDLAAELAEAQYALQNRRQGNGVLFEQIATLMKEVRDRKLGISPGLEKLKEVLQDDQLRTETH